MKKPESFPKWESAELQFEIDHGTENPYREFDGEVVFQHTSGHEITRPMFWRGGDKFAVRFASTSDEGTWNWSVVTRTGCTVRSPMKGQIPASPSRKNTVFQKHGYWMIKPGSRQIRHCDSTPAVVVADTAWALPWRALPEQVREYAEDRHTKGFNAALLMTMQPDMEAEGPRDRTVDCGFDVAFEDLSNGHLNYINSNYFDKLDKLINILQEHEIVPIYQPVFHGFGWKGLKSAGNIIPSDEYCRYCNYLVARYGADPAIWLVGADGIGDAPGLDPAGRTIEKWDAYKHPTGMHYAPHGKTDSFQSADWLDFQWVQTGHSGEHLPEATVNLYHQQPYKAVANGEPTYENMGEIGKASGWWQGHEAWSNLCAGGTMGVVYGAASLMNWILHPGEPGHADWCVAPGCGWKEALVFEGSTYVGIVGKILGQFKTTGMEPNYRIAPARRALWIPDSLLIVYISNGRKPWFANMNEIPDKFRLYDPKTSDIISEGNINGSDWDKLEMETGEPYVLVIFNSEALI